MQTLKRILSSFSLKFISGRCWKPCVRRKQKYLTFSSTDSSDGTTSNTDELTEELMEDVEGFVGLADSEVGTTRLSGSIC